MIFKKTTLTLLPNELDTALHLYAESPTFRSMFSFNHKNEAENLFRELSENKSCENDVLAYLEKNAEKLFSENGEVDIIRLLHYIGSHFGAIFAYINSFEHDRYSIGDQVALGHETDSDVKLLWNVLDIDRTHRRVLLLSKNIVEYGTHLEDASKSKEKKYLWSKSVINKWLNTEFLQKAGLDDKDIDIASVEHITRGTCITPAEVTDEKIFLFSKQECDKYFPNIPYYCNARDNRIATACKNGTYTPDCWWLREPHLGSTNSYNGTSVFFVDNEGEYEEQYLNGYEGRWLRGIRPALWLNY